jgi:hypothetical protein
LLNKPSIFSFWVDLEVRLGVPMQTVSGFNEATKFLYELRESRLKTCASTKKAPQKLLERFEKAIDKCSQCSGATRTYSANVQLFSDPGAGGSGFGTGEVEIKLAHNVATPASPFQRMSE